MHSGTRRHPCGGGGFHARAVDGLVVACIPDNRDMSMVSLLTTCLNGEASVRVLYEWGRMTMFALPQPEYEHLFIDDMSSDCAVSMFGGTASNCPRVRTTTSANPCSRWL